MRAAAAVPAIGVVGGAALGLFGPDIPAGTARAAMLVCAGIALWAWRTARPRVLVLAALLAFCAGGTALAVHAWQHASRPTLRVAFHELARAQRADAAAAARLLPQDDEAFVTVSGLLRADAAPGPSSVSLSIDVDRIVLPIGEAPATGVDAKRSGIPTTRPVAGGILVSVVGRLAADRVDDWRAGRRVQMPVQLRPPSRYLNPGVPDSERALARRGTTLVGTVKSGALVEVVARGSWWEESVAAVRSYARRAIARAVAPWSAQSGAIVAAIVIGDRAGLGNDVQRRLQEAGTYHVIAISGGNIAILAGLLLGACRFAGLLGRGAMLAAIVALLAYADLVGGGASVDRATFMAVVYFGARALDQRSSPLNTLALVAGLVVASQPLAVTDPAFVLTFGATLAILVAVPAVDDCRLPRLVRPVIAMFAASVAAEAVLFPVSALIFSRVTFAGLALNFVAIPLMAVAQVAGMVVVPLALVSSRLSAAVGYIAHLGAAGLVHSADLVRWAPILTYRVAPPALAVVVVYFAALCVWWKLWRQRTERTGTAEVVSTRAVRRVAGAGAIAGAVWILLEPWALAARGGDGRLHVTFLDVGQGDSIFARLPHGSTLLVDTGGLSSSTFDIGDRVVAPVVREQGIRRLNYLALSHGDQDHIGGAPSLVREFRPREIWEGIPVPRFDPLSALRQQAQAARIRWANVYHGDRIVVDGVEVRAWHPERPDWERRRVRNDDSMVLELRWRDVWILLTGDIGKEVEQALTTMAPAAPIRVLKVPHHGSLTSSSGEFIRALRPQVAVISVGRSNRFGHPAPAVLRRYEEAGTEIFRTDRDGAVTLDTDGTSIEVHGYTGRRFAVGQRQ